MKWVRSPSRRKSPAKTPTPRPTSRTTTLPAAIHEKHRIFARLAVQRGTSDPVSLARDAGFSQPHRGPQILLRLRDLIEQERLAQKLGVSMELDEALRIVGDLARSAEDPKLKHAATRTVLEIHGALNSKNATLDRNTTARGLEKLVAQLRDRMNGGGRSAPRVRARLQIDVDSNPTSESESVTSRESHHASHTSHAITVPARDPDQDPDQK